MVYFQVHSFASPEITKNHERLYHVINKGYNVPRYKFNIITTSRIKNKESLLEDLGVKQPEKAYIIFCFQESLENVNVTVLNDEIVDDEQITREKLKQLHSHVDFDKVEMQYDITAGGSKALYLPEKFDNSLLGTICLKPQGEDLEITGFISFYRGVGTQLLRVCESFAKDKLNAKILHITVIYEHNLREMYENWGFTFHDQVRVALSDKGVSSDHLEDNIGATQDFHLDLMSKSL